MASSSITRKYDVFVSFRGEIRLSFMDHLFAAFRRNGIVEFRDDTMIKKGESLVPELVRAIEGSLVYVVVFSKDFASSTWCLRELEMILKCVRDSGKRVFPVFYDVDPSEVRRQKIGNYAKAFANHEERFQHDLDMVRNWSDAPTQVADLSGWDMRHKHDGPFGAPQQILQQILRQILHEEPLQICNVYGATKLIQSRLCRVKALIILDNVDQGGQLDKLAMDREWLDAESRMVIVTRDQHILKEYGVDVVYNVPLLNHDDSLQLFCQKAFKRDYNYIMGDVMKDYKWLADSILEYAKGLPL